MSTRLEREDTGSYNVLEDGILIGHVVKVWFASHIRRGRMQTSPWWRAERYRDGLPVVIEDRDVWMTRRAAVAALRQYMLR